MEKKIEQMERTAEEIIELLSKKEYVPLERDENGKVSFSVVRKDCVVIFTARERVWYDDETAPYQDYEKDRIRYQVYCLGNFAFAIRLPERDCFCSPHYGYAEVFLKKYEWVTIRLVYALSVCNRRTRLEDPVYYAFLIRGAFDNRERAFLSDDGQYDPDSEPKCPWPGLERGEAERKRREAARKRREAELKRKEAEAEQKAEEEKIISAYRKSGKAFEEVMSFLTSVSA